MMIARKRVFLATRPSEEKVRQFLASERNATFSHTAPGATREQPPPGYVVDRHRIHLGAGADIFARARAALRSWEMFRLDWLQLFYFDTPIRAGENVAILVRHLGIWSLNACRIVYTIDEARRCGFAYGTLADHAESGEERFSVEWREGDDSVWYDVLAFSRPRHVLAKLGYPLARRLQKKFGRDSLRAMLRAVCSPDTTRGSCADPPRS